MEFVSMEFMGHRIYKVEFDFDEPLVEIAKEQAGRKAPYTHSGDPSARNRPNQEVYNAQLLGTLADVACQSLLQSYLDVNANQPVRVIRYDEVRTDNYQQPDRYDIRIISGADEQLSKEVEVRSSVCNRVPVSRMLEIFHVLGWYVTQNKPGEEIRDFYMRPMYHYNLFRNRAAPEYRMNDAENHLRTGALDLYIVGGATPQMLQERGEIQRDSGLLQIGATYQVVSIKSALDAIAFLEEVARST